MFGALVAVLVAVGCGQDGDDGALGGDVASVHEDAVALAEGLAEVADAEEPISIEECENDGSGPYGPATRIDLGLRPDTTIEDLRRTAEAELRRLGYTIDSVGDSAVTTGTRTLRDERQARIQLRESPSSSGDVVIGTALVPSIDC